MPSSTTDVLYYLDTNALWKFYQDQKGDINIRRLIAKSSSQVLVSPLTLLEFVGVLMKYHRKKLIKRKHIHAIAKRLRRDSAIGKTNRPFHIIESPNGSFREAENILLECGSDCDFQTNDALHLAAVIKLRTSMAVPIVLVTSDGALQYVASRKGVACYDPESDG